MADEEKSKLTEDLTIEDVKESEIPNSTEELSEVVSLQKNDNADSIEFEVLPPRHSLPPNVGEGIILNFYVGIIENLQFKILHEP